MKIIQNPALRQWLRADRAIAVLFIIAACSDTARAIRRKVLGKQIRAMQRALQRRVLGQAQRRAYHCLGRIGIFADQGDVEVRQRQLIIQPG